MAQVLKSSNYEIFYILSITDKNKSIWQSPNLLKIQSHKRGPVLDQYVWNMIQLSKMASDQFVVKDKYFLINNAKAPWKLLPIKNSNQNQGTKVISKVKQILPITTFLHPKSDEFKISGTFTFSPIVGVNYFLPFEDAYKVIYDLTVYPSMPFLVASTMPGVKNYGPLFPTEIEYRIRGNEPLEITVRYEGSKFIKINEKSPTIVNDISNYTFRTLSFYDFKYSYGILNQDDNIYDSINEFNQEYNNSGYGTYLNEKIISLTLRVNQMYEFDITAKSATDDFYYAFSNEQGAQYCRMIDRTVTGEITFSTTNPNFNPFEREGLTLYFGSIFYFPMSKVVWQRPVIDMTSNNLYNITFNFIAVAVDDAVMNAFRYGGYSSEFLIPAEMVGPVK